ncbi:polysaccharide deacetylase family protein [Marinigracilibium pacificum]|uniref:Polysaccharide deacetylase family protein n=1 Tax=Marinigracilibium pacificum TaxID=2729599 RepID=A0A848IX76_9BACT|nr:polysaccharide deacetylase family protein [Marinigracilibium pacificum]NMM47885.1 polysaccharide deacetylase family protein [Marinigracilibium pacificum]
MKFLLAKISFIISMGVITALHFTVDDFSLVWLALPVICFFILVISGSYFIKLDFFLKSVNNLGLNENRVAITFDDGPDTNTQHVLDVLDKYNAKATFFLIGSKIEKNADVVQEIITRGHAVGNHSYSHSNLFPLKNPVQIEEEIIKTNKLIKKISGVETSIFRPPFGVTNPMVAKGIKRAGMTSIGWNVRSYDTVEDDVEKVSNRVINKINPGSIILLHDDREHTPQILERILQYINQMNFETVTLNNEIELK